MDDLIKLGLRVKQLRLAHGLTQTDLAELCGYGEKSSIARIEAGSVDIPLSKIRLLAQALETTAADLLGMRGNTEQEMKLEKILGYATKMCALSEASQIAVESLIDALLRGEKK